jgi:N-methylhydantoinase A/oxoprolinase/acetone carboxylase beta subunit/predicted RNA binding protein YcfA (HicA-like mRNA interferase family)
MRTYCIACAVFRKDLEQIIPTLPDKPFVHYLEGGLHTEPDLLRKELQIAIDNVPDDYDRIVLMYGVCGKGIVGLKSSRHTMVIPRVHDCISLFLGGTKEYRKQFSHKPGTYYISPGWYEEQVQPRGKVKRNPAQIPGEYADTLDKNVLKERFGEDNSEAVSHFFDAWKKNYTRAVFIDTGCGDKQKYADYARSMAKENGWEYTKLKGSHNLILQCFSPHPNKGEDEVLVVPPAREIIFDSPSGLIHFASPEADRLKGSHRIIVKNHKEESSSKNQTPELKSKLGLGIDAGGTYTDAVLYDFDSQKILGRSKALTTKWKYSEGIMNAVCQLPGESLKKVDLVSLSTTLVTNAIVESNTYPVGLFLMPLGNTLPEALNHRPTAVIKGRMTIEGTITENIDPEEIERLSRKMIDDQGVRAFAVSGYGGSINPHLELQVKSLLRKSTGLDVCCGHELSGTLNFYVRAHTAILNAGVIPIMVEFLDEMKTALARAGVQAPCLVVKGDGSVMTGSYASEFPVQTALSGPAASMAGAKFLTGLKDALVVDVGGTTSDIGFLEQGEVAVCEEGASIASRRTHIKAVNMLTTGLGGDSALVFQRQQWTIGPERITPFCWLNAQFDLKESLNRAEQIPVNEESSLPLQWLYKTEKKPDFPLTRQEQSLMDFLEKGPALISEISRELSQGVWKLLKTERLEKAYCIQRAGLTPTDLYHLMGLLKLWPAGEIGRYFDLILRSQNESSGAVIKMLLHQISRQLGFAILEKIFPEVSVSPEIYNLILERGNGSLSLIPDLKTSVIGLGAPAALMLNEAVVLLGGELVVPENGDVANALGAITSEVKVSSSASILPTSEGNFRIIGLESFADFESLEEAEELCLESLADKTRRIGRKAGTSQKRVTIHIDDKTALSSSGDILFLERSFVSSLKGAPDLV